MADDWKPKSAVAEEDWMPPSARVPVVAHTRKPRTSPGGLSQIGGAIGQIAGSPAGLAGSSAAAGLGGMAGESIQQGLEQGALGGPGPPLAGAMLDPGLIAQAGGEQSLWGLGGGLVGKGATGLLSPASRRVAEALAARTENLVQAADKGGVVINATKVADEAMAPLLKRARAMGTDAVKALEAVRNNFLGNKPGISLAPGITARFMSATEAHEAKQGFQDLAKGIYAAGEKGAEPTATMAKQYAKLLAAKLRQSLIDNVPNYGKAMAAEAKNVVQRKALNVAGRAALSGGTALALNRAPVLKELPWEVRYGIPAAIGFAPKTNPAPLIQGIGDIAANPAVQLWLSQVLSNLGRVGTQATRQQ